MNKTDELSARCKNEIHTFFGLAVVNLVIAALILAFGISTGVTRLMAFSRSGEIELMSLLLIGAGLAAAIAGLYWLVKTAEILEGVEKIDSDWEKITQHDDQEQVTGVLVQMIAHYRKNQPVIDRMTVLGRIVGILFLVSGSLSLLDSGRTLLASGMVNEGMFQLAGAIAVFSVGIGSLLIARYFERYSGIWVVRLKEEDNIQEALTELLEAS
ncbi:MAG: hypothetical protein QGG26_08530 [Candidatus Undinarchaeales archaeon]|nr:hypothetical protein [Candidatus Undinarchaeales archaeon]